jgi:hypothetical protein
MGMETTNVAAYLSHPFSLSHPHPNPSPIAMGEGLDSRNPRRVRAPFSLRTGTGYPLGGAGDEGRSAQPRLATT